MIQWLADCGAPSVLMERDAKVLPCRSPAESVTSDHAHGGALAARHFAGLGHQRVGLVLSRNSPTSRKIAAGWHAACAELGLTQLDGFEPLLPDRSSAEFSAAINATLDTALDAGLTALLVHSDPEAMAVIDLALNRGVSVPVDLSVASYDDEIAQLFSPALTAVSPPRSAIGEAAPAFAQSLAGAAPCEQCGALDAAFAAAARDAAASEAAEPVVLLSPACASYDQFANFEQRGEAFRGLARRLIEASAERSLHSTNAGSGS